MLEGLVGPTGFEIFFAELLVGYDKLGGAFLDLDFEFFIRTGE